jgi:hypothetical protein
MASARSGRQRRDPLRYLGEMNGVIPWLEILVFVCQDIPWRLVRGRERAEEVIPEYWSLGIVQTAMAVAYGAAGILIKIMG